MTTRYVHDALADVDRELHAVELIFEYMAATQHEGGRQVPTCVEELPEVLRTECESLSTLFQPPGALLLAYLDDTPAGCVGLQPRHPTGSAEVKRLYVRPSFRRDGIARLLMKHVHDLAAHRGFHRLLLDVMPSRTHVIDFYRRLGYAETTPFPTEARGPMIFLERQAVEV